MGVKTRPTILTTATMNRKNLRNWELRLGTIHATVLLGVVLGSIGCAFYLGYFSGTRVGFDKAMDSRRASLVRIPIAEEGGDQVVGEDILARGYDRLRHAGGQEKTGENSESGLLGDVHPENDLPSLEKPEVVGSRQKLADLGEPQQGQAVAQDGAILPPHLEQTAKELAARKTSPESAQEETGKRAEVRTLGALLEESKEKTLSQETQRVAKKQEVVKEPAEAPSLPQEKAKRVVVQEEKIATTANQRAQETENIPGLVERGRFGEAAGESEIIKRQERTKVAAVVPEQPAVRKAPAQESVSRRSVAQQRERVAQQRERAAQQPERNIRVAKVVPDTVGRQDQRQASSRQSAASTFSRHLRSTIRPGWYAQVAAPQKLLDADSLAERLRRSGFPVVIERAEVRGQNYFRVLVGPESSRGIAQRLVQQVQREPYIASDPFVKLVR